MSETRKPIAIKFWVEVEVEYDNGDFDNIKDTGWPLKYGNYFVLEDAINAIRACSDDEDIKQEWIDRLQELGELAPINPEDEKE